MFCIVIVVLIVIAAAACIIGWSNASLVQSRLFRAGLFASFPVGGLLGIYSSIFVEYQASPTMRVIGFPVPAAIFLLQGGRWVDYPGPMWMLNPILLGGGLMLPFSVAIVIRRRRIAVASRRRAEGLCGCCGYNLKMNTSGVCPECGSRVPGRAADAAGASPQEMNEQD